MSFVLLSKEKGVKCHLTSPKEGMIKGDKETLLEVLDKTDYASWSVKQRAVKPDKRIFRGGTKWNLKKRA